MPRIRALLIALITVITVVVLAVFLSGPPGARGNRSVSIASVGKTSMAGIIYAYGQEKGVFERYNLNVTFHPFRDAYTSLLSLLTGKTDLAGPSPGLAGAAYSDGEDIMIAMALGEATNLMLMAKPGITNVSDLAGGSIGVMGTSSDGYYLTKWYLEKRGIDVEEEVEIVEISRPASLVTSFIAGQLEAVVLFSGFTVEVLQSGGVPLMQCSEAAIEVYGHPAYTSVFAIREEFARRGRVARDFFRAVREICLEINRNKDEAAEINARFSEESAEKTRAILDIVTLVGELDQDIQEDLVAF